MRHWGVLGTEVTKVAKHGDMVGPGLGFFEDGAGGETDCGIGGEDKRGFGSAGGRGGKAVDGEAFGSCRGKGVFVRGVEGFVEVFGV